jgi:hypothetical protein
MMACFVYIVAPVGRDSPCKVGISDDPHKRAASLSTGSPVPLRVAEVYSFSTRSAAASMEQQFHASYSAWRLNGEWFDIDFEDANYWLFENTVALELGSYGEVPN